MTFDLNIDENKFWLVLKLVGTHVHLDACPQHTPCADAEFMHSSLIRHVNQAASAWCLDRSQAVLPRRGCESFRTAICSVRSMRVTTLISSRTSSASLNRDRDCAHEALGRRFDN